MLDFAAMYALPQKSLLPAPDSPFCRYFLLLLLIRINHLRLRPCAVPTRSAHAVSPSRQLLICTFLLTLGTAALDLWHFPIQFIVLTLIFAVESSTARKATL